MKSILIVEDDECLKQFYRYIIKPDQEEIHIAYASNGREALKKCKVMDYTVILCDIQMPVMDGIEFHRRLKKRTPQLAKRVAFVSTLLYGPSLRYIIDNNCPHISKPVTNRVFKSFLETLLTVEGRKFIEQYGRPCQRRFVRLKMKEEVLLEPSPELSSVMEPISSRCLDLSKGGVRVRFKGEALERGMVFHVVSQALDLIKKEAKVVWSSCENGVTTAGLQFAEVYSRGGDDGKKRRDQTGERFQGDSCRVPRCI